MDFPTAIEVRYYHLLKSLKEKIENSARCGDRFIDVTLANKDIEKFLSEKGFIVREIRYEYNKNRGWGFFGRTSGDGHCMARIIWGDTDYAMDAHGDFRL